MDVINTKRGGKKIVLDGHMYTLKSDKLKGDSVSWRCVKLTTHGCKAILKTTKQYEQPNLEMEHNHISDSVAGEVEKQRQHLKLSAQNSNDKPNQILMIMTAAASDEVKARLPDAETIKRALRRTRSSHRPKDPQNLRQLTIENEWTQTIGDNPTDFLLYDNGPEADERIIVFSTEDHVRRLSRCSHWCIDGTFAVAPLLFSQLYVIQGMVGGVLFPFVYALLQRKTQATYETLFSILEQTGCDPTTISVDFEHSVEHAITRVFGDHVDIQFCFYHLTQSIWRKIQSLGLTNLYESDNNFRLFCGQIDALAFLPVDEVVDGMNYLKQIVPEPAEPLLEYFDATYVSGQLRPRRDINGLVLHFRRTPPMYQPHRWNVHEATISDQPRTNNASEGWNNKFHSLVGQGHPTVWKLIESLRCECSRVSAVLIQEERGIRPKKRVKKVYIELHKRLKNLCVEKAAGRKTLQEFLLGVSHNLRAGEPNI